MLVDCVVVAERPEHHMQTFATQYSAAFAGEITGNGKPTAGPAHANSICVFSGKNDDPTAPLDGSGPNGPGGVSQSFGQDVKLGPGQPSRVQPG